MFTAIVYEYEDIQIFPPFLSVVVADIFHIFFPSENTETHT